MIVHIAGGSHFRGIAGVRNWQKVGSDATELG